MLSGLLSLVLLSVTLCHAQASSQSHLEYEPRLGSNERFNEELTLKPLVDGKVSASFQFVTELSGAKLRDPATPNTTHSTPLSLGQILRTYSVSELHLTLNAGKWDYDHWGLPAHEADGDVATGGMFWAWIGEGGDMSIDEKWKGLRNALAGLFCSSLGRMDEIRTTSPSPPILASYNSSSISQDTPSSLPQPFAPHSHSLPTRWTHHLRHATLPSENVCTENLTPFLKLLPCKGKSGLASLLNPHKLFDANWHGLGVHVTWDPESASSPSRQQDIDDDKGTVEVKLTFQAILDPLRKPTVQKQDWSLNSLFARQVERSCPVAQGSSIVVKLPRHELGKVLTEGGDEEQERVHVDYAVSPEPSDFWKSSGGKMDDEVVYDVHGSEKPLNVGMSYSHPFDRLAVATRGPQGPVSVKRTLTEKSQLSGRLDVEVINHHRTSQGTKNPDGSIDILYLETMPWIVQFYLHTLVPKINGVVRPDAISNITYTPSIPHGRPTTFQATFHIPANATLTFTVDITKAFLRYTEHPPDAQRGWDLPPAVVFVPVENGVSFSLFPSLVPFLRLPLLVLVAKQDTDENKIQGLNPTYRRLYTPPLLITLATPDFSMPYNVIIFTCTVVAFVFASVFNLLTRRFVVVDMRKENGENEAGKEKAVPE
ncbi:GPI transamidase component GPI16 [Coprinopsis sp. MPI-PUGE-AT-0042]|nr:GPI transamidase component GPI16 [Coprinopsis sp. MPI-PUGE-AT-0042]